MTKQDLERAFPNLAKQGYKLTSPEDVNYNCIAWAASNTLHWWEPDPMFMYYWPKRVKREYTLQAYKDAYATLGYKECANENYEEGFEKIAIFTDQFGRPLHAARQIESGKWTSKIGNAEDIIHNSLRGLEGINYGKVAVIMKRKKA